MPVYLECEVGRACGMWRLGWEVLPRVWVGIVVVKDDDCRDDGVLSGRVGAFSQVQFDI